MVLQGIGEFFAFVFRLLAVILGLALVLAGMALLAALIIALFFGTLGILTPLVHVFHPLTDFIEGSVIVAGWQVFLAMTGLLLGIGIPLLLIILAGIQLIFRLDSGSRRFGLVLFSLWVTGLALLAVSAIGGLILWGGL